MAISFSLGVELFFFGFTLWLGAYLLARDTAKLTVRLTGLGLVAYAAALAIELLFDRLVAVIFLLPALLWIGAALFLLPEDAPGRGGLIRGWALASVPLAILTLLTPWAAVLVALAMLGCAGLVIRLARRSSQRRPLAVIAVVTLFFTLSTGLLVLPLHWLPPAWAIALLGLDLAALGLAVTIWDAFDEGERIRAPLLRSLVGAFYYAGALAALVILVSAIDGGLTFANTLLLTAVIAFGVLTQTFSNPIQSILDRLALPNERGRADRLDRDRPIVQDMAVLREVAEGLPRRSQLDPAALDSDEFTRLTRRAISSLSDLPRLSTSPLINLSATGAQDSASPLERALALRGLLIESIQRLKPVGPSDFGTSDAWHAYNCLYFPYVAGLKPYSRRTDREFLDPAARQALDWFQQSVPERTLRNWQNAAAALVAEDLRNREAPKTKTASIGRSLH